MFRAVCGGFLFKIRHYVKFNRKPKNKKLDTAQSQVRQGLGVLDSPQT